MSKEEEQTEVMSRQKDKTCLHLHNKSPKKKFFKWKG